MVVPPRDAPLTPEEAAPTTELWSVAAASPPASAPPASPALTPLPRADIEPPAAPERKPLNRLVDRVAACVRRSKDPFALPPLTAPSRPSLRLPRRSALEAWWRARRADCGMEEFLRGRLERYLARCGVTRDLLPASFELQGGRVVAAPRFSPGGADWSARYVRENGAPALALAIEHASAAAEQAEAALGDARETLAFQRHDLEAAARAPTLAASEDDGLTPTGRPAVPPPWSAAVGLFVAGLVLAEAAQFAVPLLRGAGIAPGELLAEVRRKPAVVSAMALLALGASASVFVFTAAAVRRVQALLTLLPARWHAALHAVSGAALLATAAGVAWTLLAPGAGVPRQASVIQFVVAMALPLATPRLLALARRLHARRAEAVQAATAWDQAHAAAVAQWSRARAAVSATERECASLEAARSAWSQRLYLLRSRAAEVARIAASETELENAELRRVADAIAAALEADRSAYLRHAPADAGDGAPAVDDASRPAQVGRAAGSDLTFDA